MTAPAPDCDFCKQFHSDSVPESLTRGRKIGLAAAAVFGLTSVAIAAVSVPFLSPGLRRICLPYVPATDVQVANVISALRGCSGSLVDCGSGDGRIVFAAARSGFKAVGVELNFWLVLFSRIRAKMMGLSSDSVRFERRDLFQVDYSKFDNVVVFGVDSLMPELERLFLSLREHQHSSGHKLNVVACRFPLPNIEPVHVVGQGIDSVWLYRFPLDQKNSKQ
jgi:hypothetical protein